MTTKIKWRLAERPTPSEISQLVHDTILTKDEAREILFSQETEEDRDKKSLESEVKFLRELVEKLTKGNTSTIVETIRYVEKPYHHQPWFQPYQVWCGGLQGQLTSSGLQYTNGAASTSRTGIVNMQNVSKFSDIKTF